MCKPDTHTLQQGTDDAFMLREGRLCNGMKTLTYRAYSLSSYSCLLSAYVPVRIGRVEVLGSKCAVSECICFMDILKTKD